MGPKTCNGKPAHTRLRCKYPPEEIVGKTMNGWVITGYIGRNPANGRHRVQAICPKCNEGCQRDTNQLRAGMGCSDCARIRKRATARVVNQRWAHKERTREYSRKAELRQQKAYRKIMLDLRMKQAYLDHAVACRRIREKPQMPAEWLEEYEAVTAHPEEAPRFSIPVGPSWPSTLTWAMGERD